MSGSEGADSLRDCVGEVHLTVTGRFAVQASAEEEIPRRSYRLVVLNLPLSSNKGSRFLAHAESLFEFECLLYDEATRVNQKSFGGGMLKTAEFQNFTCIPNGTWEFTDGVNVIIGENGLGKSHVLKAVYSMLRVQAEQVESSKSGLEKAYASKLVAVFRPERLGRLVKRKRGRERCEISLHFDNDKLSTGIAFATNAQTQVELTQAADQPLAQSPAFFPTRELVTLCPWFFPFYETYHLEFEETWRDTVALLSNPTLKGLKEKQVQEIMKPLESAMGGKVVLDSQTGRLYLQIPGEGKVEMPLIAEGLRKIAMLARLVSTGVLLRQGFLFWDEPETNLNPKLIKTIAESIVRVARSGVQVFVATHSLFLLRELHMLLNENSYSEVGQRWFALAETGEGVRLEQSDSIDAIQTIVALDEELSQSDRYMQQINGDK